MNKLLCKIVGHIYGGASNDDYYNKQYYDIECTRCGKVLTVKNSRNLNI